MTLSRVRRTLRSKEGEARRANELSREGASPHHRETKLPQRGNE
ncbi:hypothetical protein A2U01_0114637, partial [Trifolium medium]|nr:hypothetical protein [Trifolium medium]